MKLIHIIILFVLMANTGYAQLECIMEADQVQMDYMDATRADRDAIDVDFLSDVIITIPLTAHIIRMSDGTGGLSTNDLNTSIAQLNTAYQQVNFEFELCTVNYIDNDDHYTGISYSTSASSEEFQMAVPNLVAGTVNVFFIPNTPYCGWSSFPSYLAQYGKDWTVMKNTCATNGSTLAHEMGHYFNLYHTHQCLSACELVDGSNCGSNVGDELCDTPAELSLSGCVTPACVYFCTGTDANGDTYAPDPTNVMSYSQKQCRTFFSPQQIARIQQSFIVDRSYLSSGCDDCENTLIINTTFNNGDDEYFEVDEWIVSEATVNAGADVTFDAGNFIFLQDVFLADNGAVFLAKIDGCDDDPDGKVDESDAKVAFTNYPNPFTGQTTIAFTLVEDASVTLFVSDVMGRQVAVLLNNEAKTQGTHSSVFDASNYPAGMYYYTIRAGAYIGTKKMILVK